MLIMHEGNKMMNLVSTLNHY